MKICTQTDKFEKVYGIEKGIELLAKAGFDSIDCSTFYPVDSGALTLPDDELRERYTKLRKHIESCGPTRRFRPTHGIPSATVLSLRPSGRHC